MKSHFLTFQLKNHCCAQFKRTAFLTSSPHAQSQSPMIFLEAKAMFSAYPQLSEASRYPLLTVFHDPFCSKPKEAQFSKMPTPVTHIPSSLLLRCGRCPLPVETGLFYGFPSEAFPPFTAIIPLGLSHQLIPRQDCNNLPVSTLARLYSIPICSQNNFFFLS